MHSSRVLKGSLRPVNSHLTRLDPQKPSLRFVSPDLANATHQAENLGHFVEWLVLIQPLRG